MASDKLTVKNPSVFSIQHFCLQDGPGIRSIVFFKGCPLRCTWCQNPESWNKKPELAFKGHLCIDCNTCVQSCPHKAILSPGNRNKQLCRLCYTCADTCPSSALTRFGQTLSVDEIMEELRPEYNFFKNSSGGVTFSGGEPFHFPDFAAQLALAIKKDNIHIAVETCGMFHLSNEPSHKNVQEFISLIDLIIFDIKIFDNDAHKTYCRSENTLIKSTLKALLKRQHQGKGPEIKLRLPVIPQITDTTRNLTGWAGFLSENNINRITLIPYHNMGDAKRLWLGLEPCPSIPAITEEILENVSTLFASYHIECVNPGEEAG